MSQPYGGASAGPSGGRVHHYTESPDGSFVGVYEPAQGLPFAFVFRENSLHLVSPEAQEAQYYEYLPLAWDYINRAVLADMVSYVLNTERPQ